MVSWLHSLLTGSCRTAPTPHMNRHCSLAVCIGKDILGLEVPVEHLGCIWRRDGVTEGMSG